MDTKTIRIVNANANAQICGDCGGKCCTGMPGSVLPADLDISLVPSVIEEKLRAMLDTGRYAVDWWEGSPMTPETRTGDENDYREGYFIRPAVKKYEGRRFHGSWGGACTFHSDKGCELTDETRPGECKLLKPIEPGSCEYPDGWEGKRTVAQAWWPYRSIFKTLKDEYLND